jgi:hypothetical protein
LLWTSKSTRHLADALVQQGHHVRHDTVARLRDEPFAAESLRRWWQQRGARVYLPAKELLVTADAGGRNGDSIRVWKVAV